MLYASESDDECLLSEFNIYLESLGLDNVGDESLLELLSGSDVHHIPAAQEEASSGESPSIFNV